MKKYIALSIIGWLIGTFGGTKATAQDAPPPPPPPPATRESQEIIIRNKGAKDKKITIEITGDKVLIDGKPLAEFKDDEITINNRKMIVRDGNRLMMDFDGKMVDMNEKLKNLDVHIKDMDFDFNFDGMNFGEGGTYTYMGVLSQTADDGVKITSVTKESPAAKAGLKEGDVIYKIDDKDIRNSESLSDVVRDYKAGSKVKVYYRRDGKKKDDWVTLAEKKSTRSFSYKMPNGNRKTWVMPNPPTPPRAPNMNFDFNGESRVFSRGPKLGLRIQDTEEGTGVKVLSVDEGSTAATAGLLKDDVITEIGGIKVANTDEAREQLSENKDKSAYAVKAKRNGNEMIFQVKIPKNLKTATL